MKKSILACLVILFALTACEGPVGMPGEDGVMYWDIRVITVEDRDWELWEDADGLNPYYRCVVRWDDLDSYICQKGLVTGYMILGAGQKDEVQTPMPYVYHRENRHGEQWTETYYYDYMPGSIAFYCRYSDFMVDESPGRQQFRIVLNW
ncbi:hypothetical protein LJC35_01000 [Parabacteroides sp. OttesenSCG-928-N08]|nr:hypothetical protein [Parabacteroides sp. OttesenSCG-928-N08]